MSEVKVSLVMAVYNGEKYIKEQMDSVRNQTMKPDEVILCDDGSSDSSVELVRQYIQEHELQDSWKLYINEKNLGYADNFYSGMQKATGEYIFLCDQDDIWMLDKIERMVKIMDENPHIQMLGSEFEPYYFTEDAPEISAGVLKQMTHDESLEYKELNYKNIFIGSEGCTMCIRTDLLRQTQKYWFAGWPHDEYVWKMALCLKGCYIYHHPTLKRRLHSDNVSKRKMHAVERRVIFLKKLLQSHEAMLQFALDLKLPAADIKLIQMNIDSVKLRIELLQERKWYHTFVLATKYFNCYHSRKSIPVELLMALKG